MKYLRVEMPDGTVWGVMARVIAEHKAAFYAERVGDERSSVDYCIADDDGLIDWATNNMDWSDVERFASRVGHIKTPPVDYQDGWVNGPKEIVER